MRSHEGEIRVIGIDPGLTRCGVGIVDGSAGRTITMVDVGVVTTRADQDLPARLATLHEEIEKILIHFRPDVMAVERVFSQSNTQTVIGTAQASGVVMLAATQYGIPVSVFTPTEVKAAVTGSGRADKVQVGHMVTRILKLDAVPKPADAADALALAICQLWRGAAKKRLSTAAAVQRRSS